MFYAFLQQDMLAAAIYCLFASLTLTVGTKECPEDVWSSRQGWYAEDEGRCPGKHDSGGTVSHYL